jgi:hypothetical protein
VKYPDQDLEDPEHQEQDEYRIRRSETITPEEHAEYDELELQLHYGW